MTKILNFNLKIFWTLGFILILLNLAFYIFQIGVFTSQIYLNKEYQTKLNTLSQDDESLEINLSKSNSLSHVGNYLSDGNFVKANQVKYIQILEGAVVAK